MQKEVWICPVCGYESDKVPKECPRCSSSGKEFFLKKNKIPLKYNGEDFDVLLINGSSHSAHNTSSLVSIAEEELEKRKIKYKRFDLNKQMIYHCWCCYSMEDKACTFPCRNQFDDMPALHDMILKAKAIIVASPINWNNMSARLKDFLDRLTCIQNQPLIGKKLLTEGKLIGVMINGHEDGAMKTAWDILFYFQQMGFVLIPYGITYKTHGAQYNTITDNNYFKNDKKLKDNIKGLINNLDVMLKQDLEKKIKGKIIPVSE